MKRTIYIAGPMRGIENNNFDVFDTAKERLEAQGFNVISPTDLNRLLGFDSTREPTREELRSFIVQDLLVLFSCDSIYMLTDWQNSKGATLEHALALFLDLEIIYETSIKPDRRTKTMSAVCESIQGPEPR